ncbi:MAG TPA: hypothetical protein VM100_05135, partial [Longimicrobiales bacterium]|nr:hypothetical protein [Longimicrobiales bacterium]
NWPKMIRVSTAFTGYCAVLLGLSTKFRKSGKTPYWWFFVSGLVAGALSGLVRPSTNLALVLMQTCAAALLLGGIHWYGVTRVGAILRRSA